MFDVGLPELMVLVILAVFIFGPDKLPEVARQAGKLVRTARLMMENARSQIADELGPEYSNLDLRDLTPRALLQRHVFDDLDDEAPDAPGHRPLESGETAPYDVDAT